MKAQDLTRHLKRGGQPAAGYLFLGAEPFYRSRCTSFLKERVLGPGPDDGFFIDMDMKECQLGHVLDEANSPPLFGGPRLIRARNADAALRTSNSRAGRSAKASLEQYFADPTPETVVVLQATGPRWEDRDGKAKLQRASKYYSSVPVRVEFAALTDSDALFVGKVLAKRMGLAISGSVLEELVDLLGADAYRMEGELRKLELFAGKDREIDSSDVALLVPEARQRGMFEFSDAIADRDRIRALEVLDTMEKAGMYWGLQVSTLGALLRQALAARELGLRGAAQIRQRLAKFGIRIWHARAAQIDRVARRYSAGDLRRALLALFEVDRDLRRPRPDDRILMEMLVMKLTR